MARTQSPGYPQFALPKAITGVRKIFEADRRSVIDREVAQKHIGYSGTSGAADKALATLLHFGLLEKVGKGQVRVTQSAVDILHPASDATRRSALLQAGLRPQIYKDLHDRFGDHVSDTALQSYLVRENFLDRAIGPVSNGYLETTRFLEQEKAFESGGTERQIEGESDLQDDNAGDDMTDEDLLERPSTLRTTAAPTQPVAAVAGEEEWIRNPLGRGKSVRVLVTGAMGSKEIGKLIKLLEAQKAILDDDDEEEADPIFQ